MMTWANRRAATAASALGVCLVAAGVILSQLRFRGATISQWNGFCTSGFGQFGQIFFTGARRDCGLAEFADHAIGWMVGIGIALIIAAAVVYFAGRAAVPPAPPAPPAPPGAWPGQQPPRGPGGMG